MTRSSQWILVLGASGLLLGASDVWNTKDYKEWTGQDANVVLTRSPWAQQVKAAFGSYGGQRDDNGDLGLPGSTGGGNPGGNRGGLGGGGLGIPGGIGGGGLGTPGGIGGGGIGGGGIGRGGGRGGSRGAPRGAETMDVMVRWESALPVRQALMKTQGGDAGQSTDPQKNYIISVTGLRMPLPRDDGRDQEPASDNRRDPSQMRNMLMSTTRLMRKDKDPIAPSDVKVNGDMAQFFFPRRDEIKMEDKEVTFLTQVGREKVERKFKLKDMVYKGQLEL